jgi:hypothetical protein
VQESLNFIGLLVLESSCLTTVHDSFADHLSIANFFEEETIFADARNALIAMISHSPRSKKALGEKMAVAPIAQTNKLILVAR